MLLNQIQNNNLRNPLSNLFLLCSNSLPSDLRLLKGNLWKEFVRRAPWTSSACRLSKILPPNSCALLAVHTGSEMSLNMREKSLLSKFTKGTIHRSICHLWLLIRNCPNKRDPTTIHLFSFPFKVSPAFAKERHLFVKQLNRNQFYRHHKIWISVPKFQFLRDPQRQVWQTKWGSCMEILFNKDIRV